MIDFRYHLISLIAVFLALGIGIFMGSVVLDDAFVNSLEGQVKRFGARNDDLQDQIDELSGRLESAERFSDAAEPWLLENELAGRNVVVVTVEGTDDDVLEGSRDAIAGAGADVVSTITLTDAFALPSDSDIDTLALTIQSTSGTARRLRGDAGAILGNRLGSVAAEADGAGDAQSAAHERSSGLLQRLEEEGFVELDSDPETGLVVPNSLFLVVGGSADRRPFDVTEVVMPIAVHLSERGSPVLVAEASGSAWGLTPAVRRDGLAADTVATVDQADTAAGRTAMILGLKRRFEGVTGHYGVGDGATAILPEPASN